MLISDGNLPCNRGTIPEAAAASRGASNYSWAEETASEFAWWSAYAATAAVAWASAPAINDGADTTF